MKCLADEFIGGKILPYDNRERDNAKRGFDYRGRAAQLESKCQTSSCAQVRVMKRAGLLVQ